MLWLTRASCQPLINMMALWPGCPSSGETKVSCLLEEKPRRKMKTTAIGMFTMLTSLLSVCTTTENSMKPIHGVHKSNDRTLWNSSKPESKKAKTERQPAWKLDPEVSMLERTDLHPLLQTWAADLGTPFLHSSPFYSHKQAQEQA